ncbi:ABC-type branched-chain amino acid transport system, ATPase component [Cenarchaeum symbiosum A]|uniref:ABC-type branched-chain amino acid transport system, ATPase component n=1 Tax=Cenarchaeum symbiosum (strain A) TaxID=414004 RepID=A0RWY2_CENSY|nr:ABC-type branched-chain amino acid transport system, ATPase component [Cenarchaeum symbiosum A]
MAVISTKSLHSGYGKKVILQGVDFEAGNGITVVVGANGSGKSTVLKSMVSQCDIMSGSVMLEGREITGMRPHRIARMGVCYMPQRSNVFQELTIAENLAISSGSSSAALDLFPELDQGRGRKASQLSGGQRQMLAMAMAVTAHPKVLLFDEPTAALSPKNATAVFAKIREVQKALGTCVVLVEQNARSALEICDNAYLLVGGTVRYTGPPAELSADLRSYLGV